MTHESKQCGYLQATNTMQKGKYPDLRDTRQHLNDSTVSPTGASHKHLHINPNEKKTGKESRLPCSASTLSSTASRLSCLACFVPRKHVPLVQRALLNTCAQHPFQAPLTTLSLTTLSFERFFTSPSSTRALTALSLSTLFSHTLSALFSTLDLQPSRPALFWARSNRVR